MTGCSEWKTGEIMILPPNSLRKYNNWVNFVPGEMNVEPVCINWDHVSQWQEVIQETVGVNVQECIILLISEQEQSKDV